MIWYGVRWDVVKSIELNNMKIENEMEWDDSAGLLIGINCLVI